MVYSPKNQCRCSIWDLLPMYFGTWTLEGYHLGNREASNRPKKVLFIYFGRNVGIVCILGVLAKNARILRHDLEHIPTPGLLQALPIMFNRALSAKIVHPMELPQLSAFQALRKSRLLRLRPPLMPASHERCRC